MKPIMRCRSISDCSHDFRAFCQLSLLTISLTNSYIQEGGEQIIVEFTCSSRFTYRFLKVSRWLFARNRWKPSIYGVWRGPHTTTHVFRSRRRRFPPEPHSSDADIYIYIYNIASFLTFPNLDKKNISPIFWSEMPRGTFWSSYWPCVKRGWFLFNYSNFSLTLIRWLAAIQRLFLEALLPGVAKHSYLSVTVNNVSIIYSDKRKKVFVTIGKGE